MQEAQIQGVAEAPATAQTTGGTATVEEEQRTKWSRIMVGTAAVMLLGSFLPWATGGVDESVSGIEVRLGWVTVVTAIILGLYGYQGLREDNPNVRHHGWASAAIMTACLLGLGVSSIVDDLDEATFGAANVSVGIGLTLVIISSFFAIWPFAKLRTGTWRNKIAKAKAAVVAPDPGWYADPRNRHERRYFDGTAWSEHVADGQKQSLDPV